MRGIGSGLELVDHLRHRRTVLCCQGVEHRGLLHPPQPVKSVNITGEQVVLDDAPVACPERGDDRVVALADHRVLTCGLPRVRKVGERRSGTDLNADTGWCHRRGRAAPARRDLAMDDRPAQRPSVVQDLRDDSFWLGTGCVRTARGGDTAALGGTNGYARPPRRNLRGNQVHNTALVKPDPAELQPIPVSRSSAGILPVTGALSSLHGQPRRRITGDSIMPRARRSSRRAVRPRPPC